MPKEVANIKEFMKHLIDWVKPDEKKKKKEAPEHKPKTVHKKKLIYKQSMRNGKKVYKLKLRTKKQLITHLAQDETTAKKILRELPNSIEKVEIKPKGLKKKGGK